MALHKSHTLHTYLILSVVGLLCTHAYIYSDLTSLARNDANPPFSTLNLDDAWLLTKEQLHYKDLPDADKKKSRAIISISPFAQNANIGNTIKGHPCPTPTPGCPIPCPSVTPTCTNLPISIPNLDGALGDLTGRSGMIALLFGRSPIGFNPETNPYPGGIDGYLAQAQQALYDNQVPGTINAEQDIDPLQAFGYFSFPLNYRKRGVRFELGFQLYNDFIFRFQTGVSSIRQVVEARFNLTGDDSFTPVTPTVTKESVNDNLMFQVDNIAQQINLDIGNQNQASVEEVRFNFCWRHACEVNKNEPDDWSRFLIIPYFEVSGSLSPGEPRKPNQLFAVPFGNNGHSSTGCTAGMNFDFYNTIEVGGEVGFTHFFKKSFCNFPVPNSDLQTTIFPFQTDVSIQPGNNWHFGLRIASYHFLENLSVYFEWFVIDHKKDSVCLLTPDPAFLPEELEDISSFKTKMGNLGFNYDVSPNLGIGFLWQIPFSQRNTYRSSTLMGGVNITF